MIVQQSLSAKWHGGQICACVRMIALILVVHTAVPCPGMAAAAGGKAPSRPTPNADAKPKAPRVGHYPKMQAMAWSADGHYLFTVGEFSSLARWGPVSGGMIALADIPHHANSIATSPPSAKLILGTNVGKVEIRDGKSLALVAEFWVAKEYNTDAVALSNDERLFACCHTGKAQVWNVAERKRLHTLGDPKERMVAVAFSPDTARLAGLSDAKLTLWDVASGELVATLPGVHGDHRSILEFAPDGKTVAVTSSGVITFWDPTKPASRRAVRVPEAVTPRPGLDWDSNGFILDCATALAPDMKTAATVMQNGTVAIWSLDEGCVIITLPTALQVSQSDLKGGEIRALAYSPSGRRLAAITESGPMLFWEIPDQSISE